MFGVGRRVLRCGCRYISGRRTAAVTPSRGVGKLPGRWSSWRIQDKTGGGLIPQSQAGAGAGADDDGAAMVVVQVKDLHVVVEKKKWLGRDLLACYSFYGRSRRNNEITAVSIRYLLLVWEPAEELQKSSSSLEEVAAEVIYQESGGKRSS